MAHKIFSSKLMSTELKLFKLILIVNVECCYVAESELGTFQSIHSALALFNNLYLELSENTFPADEICREIKNNFDDESTIDKNGFPLINAGVTVAINDMFEESILDYHFSYDYIRKIFIYDEEIDIKTKIASLPLSLILNSD